MINSMSYEFHVNTIASFLCIGIGILLWFVVRRKRLRLWMPILRVFDGAERKFPRILLRPPPIIPFICFVALGAIALFYTLKPNVVKFVPADPSGNKAHIYFDMSPSVLGWTTELEYYGKAYELFTELSRKSKVSISTSHSQEIFHPASGEDIKKKLAELGFHRSGVKIGQSLNNQLQSIGDIDYLLIVSDGDRFSWDAFNWRYLARKMEVKYIPVQSDLSANRNNVYFSEIKGVSNLGSQVFEWNVTLLRNSAIGEQYGVLHLYNGAVKIQEANWKFENLSKEITFVVRVPNNEEFVNTKDKGDGSLRWVIEVAGNDSLILDNYFMTTNNASRNDALLISHARGENFIDDDVYHLGAVFSVIGIKALRLDRIPQDANQRVNFPLWVLSGGEYENFNDFCPLKMSEPKNRTQYVWLLPSINLGNYSDLCRCFIKIAGKSSEANESEVCRGVNTRESWIDVLASFGAKQVGGAISSGVEAIAYRTQHRNIDILAFTIPLSPLVKNGLTYAKLPVTVDYLLRWQGVLSKEHGEANQHWPRVNDISLLYRDDDFRRPASVVSNVPEAESILQVTSLDDLPPRIVGISGHSSILSQEKKKIIDAEIIINWLIFLVIVFLLMESIGILITFVKSRFRIDRRWLFIAFLAMALNQESKAEVFLNILGLDPKLSFERLSKEVVSRTSIDFIKEGKFRKNIDEHMLSSPWVWSRDYRSIVDNDEKLRSDIVGWIRRGGFLVIEGSPPQRNDENLTKALSRVQFKNEGWRVIPPDHEIMRSFHLIESLPPCGTEPWRGFYFDGRLSILVIPYPFLETISDDRKVVSCVGDINFETSLRIFINVLMVSLTTDYKNDQVHLPEILKRLR